MLEDSRLRSHWETEACVSVGILAGEITRELELMGVKGTRLSSYRRARAFGNVLFQAEQL